MKRKTGILPIFMAILLAMTCLPLAAFAADDIKPTHISLYYNNRAVSGQTVSVGKDKEVEIEPRIRPEDANVSLDLEWRSSNTDVASVDDSGYVTTYEPGYARITARTANSKSNWVMIYVPGKIAPGNENPDEEYSYTETRDGDVSSSSSTKSSTSSSSTASVSKTTVKLTNKLDREALVSKVSAAGGKKVTFANYASVSSASLKAAAEAGKSLVNFDTKAGKTTVGRVVVNPAAATNLTGDLKLGVYCGTANTSSVQQKFDEHFTNSCRVVLCDQANFGMTVEVVIKIGKLSDKNLKFYSYDSKNDKYSETKVGRYWKDANNYLHFTTINGGYIVVSEGNLKAAS